MRKTRNALVAAALGAGLVFGTSSVAWADGASENESQVEAGISPNAQSATTPGPATLFAQVQTFDNDEGPLKIPDKAAEQVFIDFDNDITIDPSKFAQCGGQGGNDLDTSSTQQVVENCPKDSIIGSGQAEALVPGLGRVELTITSLNGPTTVAGGACTPPADGTGGPEGCAYVGGNPQIILHAYNQGIAFITTVGGEIQNSPDSTADYGKRLAVTDAPDTAGDAGALILFNSTVGGTVIEDTSNTTNDKKRKKKGKKIIITKTTTITNDKVLHPYVSATCGDDGSVALGGKEYDFKGTWVYDDGTTDTDTYKQKCGNNPA